MANTNAWTDEQVEHAIGRLLQVGVLLSACVVFFGGALYLAQLGHAHRDYSQFDAGLEAVHSLRPILAGAARLDGRAVIQLGLLLLIATPVARVIFSIAAFWFERDHVYVLVTCVVLAILLVSLFGWRL